MRKILSLAIALMLVISAVGCNSTNGSEASEQLRGDDFKLIGSTPVDVFTLSDETQRALEEKRIEAGHYLFEEDGVPHLAVFSGERNTGGYAIEVYEISLTESKLNVSTVETEPGPDVMVTQALTYPMQIVKLEGLEGIEDLTVQVDLEDINSSDPGDGHTDDGYYISPTDEIPVGEIITVGEIMQFDGKYIHIITGDLVQVYEYDTSQAEDYYLRQTVQLVKGEEADTLEPFIIEDFSMRYTNMGNPIYDVYGEITRIDDESITISADGETVTIKYYDTVYAQIGDMVEAHYINHGDPDENGLVGIYRDDARMEMVVRDLIRSDDGSLTIYTSDKGSENVDYHVSQGGAALEVNLSELSTGDTIYVYADIIMESYPAQVIATRLLK